MKRTWVKYILSLVIFAGLFFSIGFFSKYHLPKIKKWLLLEVENQSKAHTPIRVWPQDIEASLWPLGLTLKNVRVLPQKSLAKTLAPINFKEVTVSFNILSLLKGQVLIKELYVSDFDVQLFIKKSEQKKARDAGNKTKLKVPFDKIASIPIQNVYIKNANFYLKHEPEDLSVLVAKTSLHVENNPLGIIVDFSTPNLKVKRGLNNQILDIELHNKFLIDKTGIFIKGFKLKKENSFLVAVGRVLGDMENLKLRDLKAQVRGDFQLKEVSKVSQELFPQKGIPILSGSVYTDFEAIYDFKSSPKLTASLTSKNLKVDGYEVGDLVFKSRWEKEDLIFDKITLKNSAGHLDLVNTKIIAKPTESMITTVKVHNLELQKLLAALKIPDVPVILPMSGTLPCRGQLKPQFEITCNGSVNGKSLFVYTGNKKKIDDFKIVNLDNFNVKGKVTVTKKSVNYNANIYLGKSKGTSRGVIDFKKGFNIYYDTPKISFSDVKNLVQMNLDGDLKIKGNTKGNSSYATIDMDVEAKNLWVDDFAVGNANLHFRYKSGFLYFSKLRGRLNNTHYAGHLNINILKKQIFSKLTFPFIDAEDIKYSLNRRYPFPFDVSGTGKGDINLRGPLQFNRLTYQLNSSLYRGQIADENFDSLVLNLNTEKGKINAKKVFIKKGEGKIDVTGHITPEGEFNSKISSNNLRLEDLQHFNKLKLNLSGVLGFNMDLSGHVSKPNIDLKGKATKVVVGDVPAADSEFEILISKEAISGKGNFIGNVVTTDFRVPFKKGSPLKFKLDAKKWDFTKAFNLFSDALITGEYETSITSNIDLKSVDGDFDNLSGEIVIKDFQAKRGPVYLKNSGDLKLKVTNQKFIAENFLLKGPDSFVKVTNSNKKNGGPLNLNIDSKLNMRLMALFTPFLDDIRGQLSMSVNLTNKITNPTLVGSAYIDNGYVKFKDFPHPFENLKADLLINQQSLLVNTLKGNISSGSITGNGQINFDGPKNIPINFVANIKEGHFNVPEGFKTRANADLYFKGNWFPFELGGNINIFGGSVEKSFDILASKKTVVKPSSFLPKFLLEKNFVPILLDLKVNIKNELPVKMTIPGIEINTPVIGNIALQGPPDSPLLTGKILTGQDGKVIFQSNEFNIKVGEISYLKAPPSQPYLNFNAEARVSSNLDNDDADVPEYDVTLVLQGPAQAPEHSLSSQPPLPEHEIRSLLTLGFISTDSDNEVQSGTQVMTKTATKLGSAFLTNQIGKTSVGRAARENLGVEFGVTSDIDSSDNSLVHKLYIKKQWTPKLSSSASRSTGKDKEVNAKAEYKLNKNVSVIGRWDSKESSGSSETESQDTNTDSFGVDVEYKVEFK